MSREKNQPPSEADFDPGSDGRVRSRAPGVVPGLALLAGLAALLGMFWTTASSAVHLWHTSSAYTYGYLIIPIAAYLVWEERAGIARMTAVPSVAGVIVIALFSFVWLLADFLGINEGRHIALVGMMQGLFLAVLGVAIYRKLVFPLNYLWLMVPAGEFLYAPLQAVAHAGSVVMLRASGIPVFAEGILIEVPQGSFLVEPGCAGLNFLLAALALALVYGKLLYSRLSSRVLCIVIALAVSIAANAVRIYLIIALTEWSEQRIGLADDHLLFGWGFFAVIMLALMWFGTRFSKPNTPLVVIGDAPTSGASVARGLAVTLAAVLAAAMGPALSFASTLPGMAAPPELVLPQHLGPWSLVQPVGLLWAPAAVPGDAFVQATYGNDAGQQVDVAITLYYIQRAGREAAAAMNGPGAAGTWNTLRAHKQTIRVAETDVPAAAAIVQAGPSLRAVFYWYDTAGCQTADRLHAKICMAVQRLRAQHSVGAFIAISAKQGADPAAVELALRDVAQRLPTLTGADLARVSARKD